MKIIYLCGTLTGRNKKQVLQERKQATKLLERAGFLVFDPVSIEEKTASTKFRSDHSLRSMSIFVSKEKCAIENCHALVLLTGDTPSDGSWLEMGYALYKCQMPVVLVSKLRSQGKLVSWSNVEATSIVPTVPKAVEALKRLLATSV